MSNTRFNTELLLRARQGIEKVGFVPFGPQGGIVAQQQQAAQPQQPAGGQPGAAPQAVQQQPQPQQQPVQATPTDPAAGGLPGTDQGNSDQMRSVIREELERNEQKPKKLSIQDRVTQLEGLVLRVMEHGGLIPTDPNLTNQQPSSTGVDAPAATSSQAPQGAGVKTAAQTDPLLLTLLDSVREQMLLGMIEMEKAAAMESDAPIVGSVDMEPEPDQIILSNDNVFQDPVQQGFLDMLNRTYTRS